MRAMRNIPHTDGAQKFFDYWDGLPKDGFVPDRASFNPAAIPELMRAVTILEIWARDRIEIRLAGTAVCDAMGFDPTGRNALDLVAPEARETYLRLIEAQTELPCGRCNVLRTRHAGGLVTRSEAITLPMSHARSDHSMILSFFAAIESAGFEAGRYRILAHEDTRWIDIGSGTPVWI